LRKGDAGPEPRYAAVREIAEGCLRPVELKWPEDLGIHIEEAKFGTHHGNDLLRFTVNLKMAANDGRVAVKAPLPVAIGKDDGFGRARRVVLCGKQTSHGRLRAERRKKAVSDTERVYLFRFGDAGHAHSVIAISAEALERPALLKVGEVDRWRKKVSRILDANAGGRGAQAHQAIRVGVGQRFEQHAFQNTEDGCVSADAERQSEDGDESEHRRAP
jgi:hypothetical protein